MKELDLEKLKYPIGKFIVPDDYSVEYLSAKIEEIETFPSRLEKEVIHLTDEQLDTPYRPDGWTVRQVIHHCAESHMNCYIRIKWALTENQKKNVLAYSASLGKPKNGIIVIIKPTLDLLNGLHFRLGYILKSLSESDLEKTFIHPSDNSENKIKKIIGTYAWHGNHHLAHITTLKKYKNWE